MPTTGDLPEALADDLDCNFERLVIVYQDRIFGFARSLVGNAADAEEIAQDAFVRAYRALSRYPTEQIRTIALRAWLFQITLNVFRNHRRKRRPEEVTLDGEDGNVNIDLPDDLQRRPDQIAERRERNADLARLLLALPEKYRVAVILRHVQGCGYAEIALA
ncbi:MAG TPA: RNA polymerase sigma factor, partial [Chloroflexota bacterium]|nr:RNA polymerase sigma factor [Chloroflexota bacterium]